MVEQAKLIEGERYFLISFYDDDLRIPEIETYVYVGKNLLRGDNKCNETSWYFQDPDSYLSYGPFTGNPKKSRRDVVRADQQTLELFYNLDGLIRRLSEM